MVISQNCHGMTQFLIPQSGISAIASRCGRKPYKHGMVWKSISRTFIGVRKKDCRHDASHAQPLWTGRQTRDSLSRRNPCCCGWLRRRSLSVYWESLAHHLWAVTTRELQCLKEILNKIKLWDPCYFLCIFSPHLHPLGESEGEKHMMISRVGGTSLILTRSKKPYWNLFFG